MADHESDSSVNEEEELNLGIMKAGDYMIHVYLYKGANFLLDEDDLSDSFNAIALVSCGSDKFYSSTLDDCLVDSEDGHYWKEHFFFEPKGLSSDEIQSRNLRITILNKSLFRDKKVGEFDLDISSIYFMNEQHAL